MAIFTFLWRKPLVVRHFYSLFSRGRQCRVRTSERHFADSVQHLEVRMMLTAPNVLVTLEGAARDRAVANTVSFNSGDDPELSLEYVRDANNRAAIIGSVTDETSESGAAYSFSAVMSVDYAQEIHVDGQPFWLLDELVAEGALTIWVKKDSAYQIDVEINATARLDVPFDASWGVKAFAPTYLGYANGGVTASVAGKSGLANVSVQSRDYQFATEGVASGSPFANGFGNAEMTYDGEIYYAIWLQPRVFAAVESNVMLNDGWLKGQGTLTFEIYVSANKADYSITSPEWVYPQFDERAGVKGEYSITGAYGTPGTLQLYWSGDDQLDSGDAVAFTGPIDSSDGIHDFRVPANEIMVPNETHKYLIAAINVDPNDPGFFDPAKAKARELTVTMEPAVEIDKGDDGKVQKGEEYYVAYAVTNTSPVIVRSYIKTSWSSSTSSNEVFDENEVELKPGILYVVEKQERNDWEWISAVSPLDSPFWEAGFLSQLGKLSTVASLVSSVLKALKSQGPRPFSLLSIVKGVSAAVLNAVADVVSLEDINPRPISETDHWISVFPQVKDAPVAEGIASLTIEVSQEKLNHLSDYRNEVWSLIFIDVGVAFAGVRLGSWIGLAAAVAGTIANHLAKKAILTSTWNAAHDPPDPDFQKFNVVTFPDDSALNAAYAPGPWRGSKLWEYFNTSAIQQAFFDAINKRDGAVAAQDELWHSQQLVDAAVLSNQGVFDQFEQANLEAFTQPLSVLSTTEYQRVIDTWRADGLSSEVQDSFRSIGWSDEAIASFSQEIQDLSAVDLQESENGKLDLLQYSAIISSTQTIDLLHQAIDSRAKTQNGVVRELAVAEKQLLDSYQDELSRRALAGDYGGDFLAKAKAYANTAIRLALATNNIADVDPYLEQAYFLGFSASGRPRGIDNFIDSVTSNNQISSALQSTLLAAANDVRAAIADANLTALEEHLQALSTAISGANSSEIDPTLRVSLSNLIDGMIETSQSVPRFLNPSLMELPDSVTLKTNTAQSVFGNAVSVTGGEVPSYIGGQLAVHFPEGMKLEFGAGAILTAGEFVSVNQVNVARVGQIGDNALRLDLLADATPENLQALLRSIAVKQTGAQAAFAGHVQITLSNGIGGTAEYTLPVQASAVINQAPKVGAFDTQVNYTASADPILLDVDATVTDVDSANFAGGVLTVKVAANASVSDRIGILNTGTGPGQISVSGNEVGFGDEVIGTFAGTSTLIITLNEKATPLATQALLRSLTFASVSSKPSLRMRKISVTLTDGDGGTSPLVSKNVKVVLNADPVITGFEGTVTYGENAGVISVDEDAVVTDANGGNLNKGKLTIQLSANGQSTDVLEVRNEGTATNQIGLAGRKVTFGKVRIGTVVGGTGTTPLIVTLNAKATPAIVTALLRNITFRSTSGNASSLDRTVKVTLTDGDGGTSNLPTKTINITPINDALARVLKVGRKGPRSVIDETGRIISDRIY